MKDLIFSIVVHLYWILILLHSIMRVSFFMPYSHRASIPPTLLSFLVQRGLYGPIIYVKMLGMVILLLFLPLSSVRLFFLSFLTYNFKGVIALPCSHYEHILSSSICQLKFLRDFRIVRALSTFGLLLHLFYLPLSFSASFSGISVRECIIVIAY